MKRIFEFRSIRVAMMTLVAAMLLAAPMHSYAGVFISVGIAPPILPVYAQPICPGDGYIWTPGYWAYGDEGYYWVPGTWVLAPQPGFLWTPGYWGWSGGVYIWHAGYWGPHIGFYGGVNYGFGYFGTGFYGGRWEGGHFLYNTAYSHVNVNIIHNTYINRTTIVTNNRVAFNGGAGGIQAHASAQEMAAEHDRHIEATPAQTQHVQAAAHDRANFASVNHGVPAHAAMARPATSSADFARATPARTPAARPAGGNMSKPSAQTSYGGQRNRAPAAQSHPAEQQHSEPQQHAAPQQHAQPHAAPHPSGGEERK